MAAPGPVEDGLSPDVFSSFTLTYSGINPSQGIATDSTGPSAIPRPLATATGVPSSPLPTASSLGAGTSPSSTSQSGSGTGGGINKNVQNLLIAVGCAGEFLCPRSADGGDPVWEEGLGG